MTSSGQLLRSLHVLARGACALLASVAAAAACADEPASARPDRGRLDVDARIYYMQRAHESGHIDESLAAGGSLLYETPWWRGLGAGAGLYASEGLLFKDPDRDGAGLLAPGQEPYAALGQAYLQGRAGATLLRLYRQSLDTPLINAYDCKMTPVTVEAYTLEMAEITNLALTVSHVRKIKPWTASRFRSMTEAAGYADTDGAVTLGGLAFAVPGLKLQAWEYYCDDIMNAVYCQADATWKIADDLSALASVLALDQRDLGESLAGEFRTGQAGALAGVNWAGLDFSAGFTIVDRDHDIVNPWGSYPGYTSIIEEDFNLAGERAFVLGLGYDFSRMGLEGLSAFANHCQSYFPEGGDMLSPDRKESDLTLDYRLPVWLPGLWLRGRVAAVSDNGLRGGRDYNDFRIIVRYDFSPL